MASITISSHQSQRTLQNPNPSSCFQGLPESVKEKIFSELPVPDAVRVRRVCREWHQIMDSSLLWNFFLHRDFPDAPRLSNLENPQENYVVHFHTAMGKSLTAFNMARGRFLQQDLDFSYQTPILYENRHIICGCDRYVHQQSLRIFSTATEKLHEISLKTHYPACINFNTLAYAHGFIIAASERQPYVAIWNPHTGEERKIKIKGIAETLGYHDGRLLLSYADNEANQENNLYTTIEILDFNPKKEAKNDIVPIEDNAQEEPLLPESTSDFTIQALPPEILSEIFGILAAGDTYNVRLVCSQWNEIINAPSLWRDFFHRDFGSLVKISAQENPQETYSVSSNLEKGRYASLSCEIPGRIHPPCIADGKIAYVSKDKKIHVIDALSGSCIYSLEAPLSGVEKLAYAHGKLLILSKNYEVIIVDMKTGQSIKHKIPCQIFACMTYGDGKLFVGNMSGKISIFDSTGNLVQTLQGKGKVCQSLTYSNGILFCSYYDHISEMWDFTPKQLPKLDLD